MQDRRTFIAGMIAAGLTPKPTWADAGNPAFLSAGLRPDGTHVLCGLTEKGKIAFELPLPARGHAATCHPLRAEAVAFARRPGTFALVINCASGHEVSRLDAPSGRHFYGHGAFSADGDLLFTTENDYENAAGVVGVWDARNGYARLGEFPSGGTGPHELRLMPAGDMLVVANGGIETHPDTGRTKLNIPVMRPNLAYLSLDGRLVDVAELDPTLHKNSIRHLAVANDGTVAFAMQWQGDISEHPPVLAIHRRGAEPELMQTDLQANARMAGYAGSVAMSHGMIAVTSPRGGLCQMFDLPTRKIVRELALRDVCGVAASGRGIMVTNGQGEIGKVLSSDYKTRATHSVRWDNHLVPVHK